MRFKAALTAGACLALFGVLLGLVESRWGPLLRLDQRTEARLHSFAAAHTFWTAVQRMASALLSPTALRITAGLVVLWLWWRGARVAALWVALVTACQAALEVGVKDAVARPRPAYGHPVATATGWSFPSGHAMTAATLLSLFALLLLPHARGRAARWSVLGAAALLVLLVSWSRLGLAVHWPSDVLGGWLLAGAVLGAVTAGLDALRPGRRAAETAALHLRSSRRVQRAGGPEPSGPPPSGPPPAGPPSDPRQY